MFFWRWEQQKTISYHFYGFSRLWFFLDKNISKCQKEQNWKKLRARDAVPLLVHSLMMLLLKVGVPKMAFVLEGSKYSIIEKL